MSISPNEKNALEELQESLQKSYEILDFRLFGSKAKGTDHSESDLDVMIVLEELSPEIESEIDDIIFEINLRYDCLITSLYFSRRELEIGSLTESPIYKKILREGVVL